MDINANNICPTSPTSNNSSTSNNSLSCDNSNIITVFYSTLLNSSKDPDLMRMADKQIYSFSCNSTGLDNVTLFFFRIEIMLLEYC